MKDILLIILGLNRSVLRVDGKDFNVGIFKIDMAKYKVGISIHAVIKGFYYSKDIRIPKMFLWLKNDNLQ